MTRQVHRLSDVLLEGTHTMSYHSEDTTCLRGISPVVSLWGHIELVADVVAQVVVLVQVPVVASSSRRSLRSSPMQVLGADTCQEDKTERARSYSRWNIRQRTSQGPPSDRQ